MIVFWAFMMVVSDRPAQTTKVVPPGWVRQSSDHRCTRILLRSGVGIVITFLNAFVQQAHP